MTARLRAGLVTATLAAAALLACEDPNAPVANFDTYADTLELYAMNGSPLGAPTAISIIAGVGASSGVPTDGAFEFDVAVDINAEGRPVLHPVRAIAAPFISRHSVGLQRTTQSFESITRAPDAGYRFDTSAVVSVGEVVLIQSANPAACPGLLGTGLIYAKVVVDSIRPATRRLFVRVTADPNCGFRSLVPGRPED